MESWGWDWRRAADKRVDLSSEDATIAALFVDVMVAALIA
jgi:hypothetical protein